MGTYIGDSTIYGMTAVDVHIYTCVCFFGDNSYKVRLIENTGRLVVPRPTCVYIDNLAQQINTSTTIVVKNVNSKGRWAYIATLVWNYNYRL